MKALAIHGHFYQPPREDPATGEIPPEPSAAPFDHWNQRITAECYRPNAELGNFDRLSFNLGPTLATWMEKDEPEVLRRIVAGDRVSRERWGEGGALAQPFHHTILPLATRREKELEVAWGIADFVHRFGHKPRGLWLPETAVDTETLAVVAEAGIELVILAPWQARRAGGGELDPSRPAWVKLPGGRRIAVFLYRGEPSARLSFDPQATSDADRFAGELAAMIGRHPEGPEEGRLLLLATDGELYGHHQKFRDLFLARLLGHSAEAVGFAVPPLAHFLDLHPPRQDGELIEPTAWSCHHGIDRWSRSCGCTPEGAWKTPLRRALCRLAADLDTLYERTAGPLVGDPWALARSSAQVILGQRPMADLLRQEARQPLDEAQIDKLGLLLTAQWQRHRMFASCAWFWNDFDRLEPRHNLAAAALAADYARRATGEDVTAAILPDLALVISARTGVTAREVFTARLARYRQTPAVA